MTGFHPKRLTLRISEMFAGLAVCCLSFASGILWAQPSVDTIGGGPNAFNLDPAGYFDGSLSGESQFHTPGGIALDSSGLIFIADQENSVIRIADLEQDQVYTFPTPPSTLVAPVDVAIEERDTGELYLWVADPGANAVFRFDAFGNVVSRWNGFTQLAALTLENSSSALILEQSGALYRIQDPVPGIFNKNLIQLPEWSLPANTAAGIVVLNDGRVAVSDAGDHVIRIFGLGSFSSVTLISEIGQEGIAGFRDGNTLSQPLFNAPAHIAKAGNDIIIVADRLNHRVRLVYPQTGLVNTLYGVSPATWGPVYPGWLDGLNTVAEAREPFGVVVGAEGQVYSTERYYHLLRQVTESSLTGPTDGGAGSNTNIVVAAPTFQPSSGYFPAGTEIRIQNQNTNVFFENRIYYTIDGSDPTTNSLQVTRKNAQGEWVLSWDRKDVDLTSLRMVSSLNGVLSEVVGGDPVDRNIIGVKESLIAGPGSSVIIPVTVDLQPEIQLRSLQFLVEVTPDARTFGALGFPDPVEEPFSAVTMQDDDFIPVIAASTNAPSVSPDEIQQNLLDANGVQHQVTTRRLAVAFLGTNTQFSVENFAVTALISASIPVTAQEGDTYTVRISNPSGTSDGFQAVVPLNPLPAQKIKVGRTGYLVGDSSPSTWYNSSLLDPSDTSVAGFGNHILMNDDVNNAFLASLGVRVPFPNTDLFDAMDVFPSDIAGFTGGDGAIRFLDWQTILRRSLGLDTLIWYRYWQGGERIPTQNPTATASSSGIGEFQSGEASQNVTEQGAISFWDPNGRLEVEHLVNQQPGSNFRAPVYLHAMPGSDWLGLSFRVQAIPMAAALPEMAIRFVSAPGIPDPYTTHGLSVSDLLCGWSLNAFTSPLRGNKLLGWIEGTLPSGLDSEPGYALRWEKGDGAVAPFNQALVETRSGGVWLQSPPESALSSVSPEWIQTFFGNEIGSEFAETEDTDMDGMNNLQEYLAGTHPLDAESTLKLNISAMLSENGKLVLSWHTVPGKTYSIEGVTSLDELQASHEWEWETLNTDPVVGNGEIAEFIPAAEQKSQYYRLKVTEQ